MMVERSFERSEFWRILNRLSRLITHPKRKAMKVMLVINKEILSAPTVANMVVRSICMPVFLFVRR